MMRELGGFGPVASIPINVAGNMYPPLMAHPMMLEEEAPCERSCTNPGWVWFLACSAIVGTFVASHALSRGVPAHLYKGVNFQGKVCGFQVDMRLHPYLYYPLDPSTGLISLYDGRCLTACPTKDDVASKRSVATTKRLSRHYQDIDASMMFEFDIATPAYTTQLVGNAFCIPIDSQLRQQLAPLFTSTWRQVSFAMGGVCSAWPVVFGFSTLGALFASFFALFVMNKLPVVSVYGSAVILPLLLFFEGFYFFSLGFRNSFTSLDTDTVYFGDTHLALCLGILMILSAVGTGIFALYSKRGLHRAARALDTVASAYSDMPNLATAPLLSSSVSFIYLAFWTMIFLHIGGLAGTHGNAPVTDGGDVSFISPFHSHLFFPTSGYFALLFWIVSLFWTIEIVKATQSFVVAYTGTVWYFALPEGAPRKDMGWCPVLVSLSIGILNHLGSFTLGGVLMGITAPVRTLFSWTASKNMVNPDESTIILNNVLGKSVLAFRNIVEFFSIGGYVEMAISSANFWDGMTTSSRRLGIEGSPSRRLCGALSGVQNAVTAICSLIAAALTFGYLSTVNSPYTTHTSAYFVASPIFASLVCFIFTWILASPFLASWTALADSIFYSHLVESSSPNGEIDEDVHGKVHIFPDLRDLLVETMHDEEL